MRARLIWLLGLVALVLALVVPAPGQQGTGSLIQVLLSGAAKVSSSQSGTWSNKITDGSLSPNVASGSAGTAAGGNALLTSGTAIQLPFSVSASGDVAATVVNAAPGVIRGVSLTFSSVGSGNQVQILQSSNSWTSSYAVMMTVSNVLNSGGLTTTPFAPSASSIAYCGNVAGSSIKLNVSTYSSGTITGVITYYTAPAQTQTAPPATYPLGVGSAGSAPGMTNVYQNGALSNTPVQVKASSGNVYHIRIYNPNGSGTVSVELFTTSPTLGSTVPFDHFTLGASTQPFESKFVIPETLSGSIYIVCVTAYNGSTAPSTGVDVSLGYN
ncbi:MAG: hypothetical protein P4L46_17465 [Fimbriimonas sp.]|nr:hypothetical protein [Fimbriimonas sp.]